MLRREEVSLDEKVGSAFDNNGYWEHNQGNILTMCGVSVVQRAY
jgi:hypothetical protein